MKMNARFLLLIFALLLAGCELSEQPRVKVTVLCKGFDAEEMDDLVAVEIIESVKTISPAEYVSVSTAGQVDVYAIGETGVTSGRFMKDLNFAVVLRRGRLPDGCKVDKTEVTAVPEVVVEQIDTYQVEFDSERLAKFGLTVRDASESLGAFFEKPATQQGAGEMENLEIATPNGEKIRLRDVATIEIVQKPSHIIRRWPEKP